MIKFLTSSLLVSYALLLSGSPFVGVSPVVSTSTAPALDVSSLAASVLPAPAPIAPVKKTKNKGSKKKSKGSKGKDKEHSPAPSKPATTLPSVLSTSDRPTMVPSVLSATDPQTGSTFTLAALGDVFLSAPILSVVICFVLLLSLVCICRFLYCGRCINMKQYFNAIVQPAGTQQEIGGHIGETWQDNEHNIEPLPAPSAPSLNEEQNNEVIVTAVLVDDLKSTTSSAAKVSSAVSSYDPNHL
mmetsp:Transcript_13781/g.17392  ORF Transcript_13781/g.17392 Transcript_13781/m.17392 type:complete len:243 (+) Transcript_13781:90-818(+)|eukprot:CAMPEP_0203677404 /NCGR_PEP_ID=MMETSP0090-20130426/28099_1 /ASSEMBLY_ACC=CAM_ASM_001088 /TAXON_ID=426623 /ORGANISM="Chaetoceros affinis, Strain CCMP159" /LENGTH=242 /DNA_ID=CAMNT_0050544289 /DNA_START=132 /DNA_END=860 /DNA_ORIENTATION=-